MTPTDTIYALHKAAILGSSMLQLEATCHAESRDPQRQKYVPHLKAAANRINRYVQEFEDNPPTLLADWKAEHEKGGGLLPIWFTPEEGAAFDAMMAECEGLSMASLLLNAMEARIAKQKERLNAA